MASSIDKNYWLGFKLTIRKILMIHPERQYIILGRFDGWTAKKASDKA